MASEWRYRGRVLTADDVTLIRQLIAENPGASRRRLSEKLCVVWQWKQVNGALRRERRRRLVGEFRLLPQLEAALGPIQLARDEEVDEEAVRIAPVDAVVELGVFLH